MIQTEVSFGELRDNVIEKSVTDNNSAALESNQIHDESKANDLANEDKQFTRKRS